MRRLSLYLQRQWASLMLALLCGGLALDAFCGSAGPRDLLILHQHCNALIRQRQALLLDNAAYTERIARLRADDAYLERLIRQELGYVRPGELVYRFPQRSSNEP